MNTLEIGKKLVELCRAGKNEEAVNTLFSADIVSVEAGGPPGQDPTTKGIAGVLGKGKWWMDNHTVHDAKAEGPWPHGDRFIVRFTYDVTFKPENKRFVMDEAALYTVANGKVVKEEFFYSMG
ncbi:MAG: nuclear transport factor 2 family protein [Burkholderiaceae bacterium]